MNSRFSGNRYEIITKIGEGGAANVFLARDISGGFEVALKIPSRNNEAIYDSLKKEYLFSIRHRHPSLLRPLGMFFESGKPVLVSPCLKGPTLDDYINSLREKSDTEQLHSALGRILAAVLECADFIHFSGYCYNDFKPANIICQVDENKLTEPEIALIDFNLVSSLGERPGRRGTLQYLAPEIITGDPPTPRADIYSLGVIFFQLITGELPFDGENSADFIANISNPEEPDFADVSPRFRAGLRAMLEREPEKRPSGARETAELLGISDRFNTLSTSRTEYYLASGDPPFAVDLKNDFENYLKSNPGRLFYIRGYSYGDAAINFLESECVINRIESARINRHDDESRVRNILDRLNRANNPEGTKRAVFIEDLETQSGENLRRLSGIINSRAEVAVIATGGRWHIPEIKHIIFDPVKNRSAKAAAEICLESFLKREDHAIDSAALAESTGGDPEQIFGYLKNLCEEKKADWPEILIDPENYHLPSLVSENEGLYKKMHDITSRDQRELLSVLSAWGNTIPLLLFVNFERPKHEVIEEMVRSGHFVRRTDSVAFFCGGFREYIYRLIPDSERREFHRFWAEAAEELIGDGGERLGLTARHWALSGNTDYAYRYNESAAREFFRNGDYHKAIEFGQAMIEFAGADRERMISALKINGDIFRAVGYFRTARKMYIEALTERPGHKDRAAFYKRLAGLYLDSGNCDKSIQYAERSLEYYDSRKDGNNTAACRAIIVSALWGKREYREAMDMALRTSGLEIGRRLRYLKDTENEDFRLLGAIHKIAEELRNNTLIIKSYKAMGNWRLKNGDFDDALGYFKKALFHAEKTENRGLMFETLMSLGSCYFNSGDLFMAIECFQQARETADGSGNVYRKTLAELSLTEISLAMGNCALADRILSAIENDPIYKEDKTLRLRTDLSRVKLAQALGDKELAGIRAESILRSAAVKIKPELALEAEAAILAAHAEVPAPDISKRISEIVSKALLFDGPVLTAKVKLLAGDYCVKKNDYKNASSYYEEVLGMAGAPRDSRIEAAISRCVLPTAMERRADVLEGAMEMEGVAAGAGFMPLALKAAGNLGRLYFERGRLDLYQECERRADEYLSKLLSALPKGYPAEKYRRKLVITRPEQPVTATDRRFSENKEKSAANAG
jgi:serine/threonine protein kinase